MQDQTILDTLQMYMGTNNTLNEISSIWQGLPSHFEQLQLRRLTHFPV